MQSIQNKQSRNLSTFYHYHVVKYLKISGSHALYSTYKLIKSQLFNLVIKIIIFNSLNWLYF